MFRNALPENIFFSQSKCKNYLIFLRHVGIEYNFTKNNKIIKNIINNL